MVLEGYHDLMKEIFARGKHKMIAEGLFQLDENEMVVKWKALLHIAKTPGLSVRELVFSLRTLIYIG